MHCYYIVQHVKFHCHTKSTYSKRISGELLLFSITHLVGYLSLWFEKCLLSPNYLSYSRKIHLAIAHHASMKVRTTPQVKSTQTVSDYYINSSFLFVTPYSQSLSNHSVYSELNPFMMEISRS